MDIGRIFWYVMTLLAAENLRRAGQLAAERASAERVELPGGSWCCCTSVSTEGPLSQRPPISTAALQAWKILRSFAPCLDVGNFLTLPRSRFGVLACGRIDGSRSS